MAQTTPEQSKKRPIKVAREVAELEFDKWAEALGLDPKFDADFVDPNMLKALNSHRNNIVRAIMYGHAVLNDKFELVFTPQRSPHKTPLVFRAPNGGDYKQMDKHVGSARNFAFLASICGQNDNVFDQMDMIYDGEICSSVVALFLA